MRTSAQLLLLALVATSVNALSITLIPGTTSGTIQYRDRGSALVVNTGESITLVCTVRDDTQQNGVWSFNGNTIGTAQELLSGALILGTDNVRSSVTVVAGGGTTQYRLQLTSINEQDMGVYRCVAGSDFDTVDLFVTGTTTRPPTTIPSTMPPTVTAVGVNDNGIITFKGGVSAQLQCQGASIPKVLEDGIEWFFEGVRISKQQERLGDYVVDYYQNYDDDKTVVSMLKIPDVTVDKVGQYMCVFMNPLGTSSAIMDLQIMEESGGDNNGGKISILRVTRAVALDTTSIQVDWQAGPEIDTVGLYLIRVSSTATGRTSQLTASSTARSIVFTGLEPGTEYEVAVAPFTNGVPGAFSDTVRATTNQETDGCTTIKPRRTDLTDLGSPCLFRGWVDVQGQGANNDYCRVISNGGQQYLSCALAGSTDNHVYTSPNKTIDWFDAGHVDTWYMKDEDNDGRDDYCRCVGIPPNTVVSCMKAGEDGFVSHDDFQIQESSECHLNKVNPFFGVA
ncbi:uncharacterized protein [Amphiura filiformis]|uniref:uncharacterized protein n=1 Tax=Amphiura filiformis TaxID=82378 RepID=UPI003B214F76